MSQIEPLTLSLLLGGAVINLHNDYKFNVEDLKIINPVRAIVYGNYIINPDSINISTTSFKNSLTIYVVEQGRTLRAKYFPATKKIHVAGITSNDLTQMNNIVQAIINIFPVDAHACIVSVFPISAKYKTKLLDEKKYIDLKSIYLEFEKEKKDYKDYRIQYNPERHSSLIIRKTNKYAVYVFNSGVINIVSKTKADAVSILRAVSRLIDLHIY
jgi:hypothetical protein